MVGQGWEVRDNYNEKRLGSVGAIHETKTMHPDGTRCCYEFFVVWDDGKEGWVGENDVTATGRRSPAFPPVNPL